MMPERVDDIDFEVAGPDPDPGSQWPSLFRCLLANISLTLLCSLLRLSCPFSFPSSVAVYPLIFLARFYEKIDSV
jgi:hypothetical protein